MAQPRVSVFVGISLDGFIARPNGAVDWLESGDSFIEPDGAVGFVEFMSRVDALIMGRNTFDFVHGTGQWHYGDTPVHVATHRALPSIDGATLHAISGTAAEMRTELAAAGAHRLYVDGGQLVHQFLAADLVDELVLTRLPVAIGSGISVFPEGDADKRWEHVATHANQSAVQSIYRRPDSSP